MAITDETPQVSKGFKEWQRALFRHGPKRLTEIIHAGNQIRALTGTRRVRR